VNPLIPLGKMQKARALEIPVFRLIKQTMTSKLGKPVKDNRSGSLRTVEWKTSRTWVLEYEARPQTSITGNKVPDFIIKRDDTELLAVECKNWALKSKWSKLSAQDQIIDRFTWLATARRIVLSSHLDANGPVETAKIRHQLDMLGIEVQLLGNVVGEPPLQGTKIYKKLGPIVGEWLGFVRKKRKKPPPKGQKRIDKYIPKGKEHRPNSRTAYGNRVEC